MMIDTNKQEGRKGMYTVETKSMLAKLMAMENLTIEQRGTRTASFNPSTRTLTVPVWSDISGELYDLLMGHEVSHALNTPADGWHDAQKYFGKDKKVGPASKKAFGHFLNVVEDARIEKLIKRTYPGLRRPMIQGYKELMARDFFGLSKIADTNELYLIDKLNLAAKLGTAMNIRFTAKEKPYYDELMALETWEQVVELTNKLFTYSKEEQQEGNKKKQELADHLKETYAAEQDAEDAENDQEEEEDGWSFDEDEEEGDEGGGSGDEDEEDGDEGKDGKGKGENADDEEDEADDATTEKQQDQGQGKRSQSKKPAKAQSAKGTGGTLTSDSEFIPESKTDEAFRNMEQSLAKDDNIASHYVNIPTPNLEDIVVPASKVNKLLSEFYSTNRVVGMALFNEFKRKNEDYISLLAKEFEMKKAARSYAKAKISDSGDIDLNKLATYRLEDNMFRKMMVVHKGKSHGLVLLLDKSGSMSEHIEGAMEQILVMAMFCRKVNIPFVAYTFTANGSCSDVDFPNRGKYDAKPLKQFSLNTGDLYMGELSLREMFNSRMSASDFITAVINHLSLANGLRSRSNRCSAPSHEGMGSTPLNEALVPLRDMLRAFKASYRLDLVNTIIVHDGDSDGNRDFWTAPKGNFGRDRIAFDLEHQHVTLVDTKEKVQIKLPKSRTGVTIGLMKWIQMTTGSGVFGFYITSNRVKDVRHEVSKLYTGPNGFRIPTGRWDQTPEHTVALDKLAHQLIETKFLESFADGYTRLFFIPGSHDLKTESGLLAPTVDGYKWTPGRLLTAFKKVSKRKSVSRVLVTKFITMIAE